MKKTIDDLVGKCEKLTALCLRFAVGEGDAEVERLAGEIAEGVGRLGEVPGRDARYVVSALQSPLMAPHVAAYAGSYLIMVFVAFGIGRRFASLGFCLMTFGLVLGAVWGKFCWGDYWQYDPKEMWGLATWLTYLACFSLGDRPRLKTALNVIGVILILLTATLANFSRLFHGLHSYA